jgi:hypothetical protein
MSQEDKKSAHHAVTRVSSQEIDDAILRLQAAFGDGRVDEKDFGERMGRALTAKTHGELSAILFDLPDASVTPPVPAVARRLHKATAIFSGIEQRGRFILPSRFFITAIMGGYLLDLSQAQFESAESTVHITAIMGGVQVAVPTGIRIMVSGSPIMGGISQNLCTDHLPQDAPYIHIIAKAILGGIEIKNCIP